MIETIEMKNCATYSEDGAKIADCKKVNFIYGPNGSGKSTISSFLSSPNDERYSDCRVVSSSDSDMLVYNRAFKENHFREDIEGVFTLGHATIEDINKLEHLKSEKENLEKVHSSRVDNLQKIDKKLEGEESSFTKNIWSAIFKRYDSEFQYAFQGFRNNKKRFRYEILRRYKGIHTSNMTRENLTERAKVLFSENREKAPLINRLDSTHTDKIFAIENDSIWQKVVIGSNNVPISELILSLHNGDWVNQGRHYIHDSDICPFCQGHTISDDFKRQLESFFDGEYKDNVNHIANQIESFQMESERILADFKRISSIVHEKNNGDIEIERYDSLLRALELQFNNTIKSFIEKKREVSKKVEITSSKPIIDDLLNIVNCANNVIKEKNKTIEDFDKNRKKLVDDVWEFCIIEQLQLIKNYNKVLDEINKKKKRLQTLISESNDELRLLDEEIIQATKNMTSVQPTVDEINSSLKAYGFNNFMIVPSPNKENYYQIQRPDGKLAKNTLSEGEETFITFLYFLQFAKGSVNESKVSSKKILVIDDPISSLDSTVLYIVSSMVKSLIKDVRAKKSNVEQIFILTHNVFFHKEASYIDGREQKCNDINYWVISKEANMSTIHSFGMENPIKTSYELLWQELKINTRFSQIAIQNVMRRILENYFKILGKIKNETIVDSFETSEDKMICRSLISWINDGSHSIPDDLYIDSYTDMIPKYKEVFRLIFKNMGHIAHYNMMMGIDEENA